MNIDLINDRIGEDSSELDIYEWVDDIYQTNHWLVPFDKTSGPINIPPESTPIELFRRYFDHSFIKQLVEFSNEKAKERCGDKNMQLFKPITVGEFEKFIGIQIFMSYNSFPEEKDHWSTDPYKGTPMIKRTMSRDRYLFIKNNLCFYDRHLRNESDELFKIRKLFDRVPLIAKSMYQPSKELSIDESLILFKGKWKHMISNPHKAAKRGLETFDVCEARTGYMLNWKLYTGTQVTDIPKTEQTVVDLLKGIPQPEGHHVFTDRFYTSPSMAKRLGEMKIGLTGTVRKDRKGLPDEIKSIKLSEKEPGPIYFRNGHGAGNICVMAWHDNGTVIILSTIYGI